MPELIRELLLHYRDLLRHLRFTLRNHEDAADIAQTSFERVYRFAQGISGQAKPIESPRALLFHTAQNLCIDQARHRQTSQAWLEERTALQPALVAPSAEHVSASRQLVERVVAQLEQLPPRRREVFLLFRAHGHTQAEIAARLSITEAAVAKHVLRATLDCSRVFADLAYQMPVAIEPTARPGLQPALAEEQ